MVRAILLEGMKIYSDVCLKAMRGAETPRARAAISGQLEICIHCSLPQKEPKPESSHLRKGVQDSSHLDLQSADQALSSC